MARKAKIKPKRPLRHRIERPEPKRAALPTPSTLHQWNTAVITVVRAGRGYYVRVRTDSSDPLFIKVTGKQALKAATAFGIFITEENKPIVSNIL